jgi:hypothetical protein
MTAPIRIGFDRTIRRPWLDSAAALAIDGIPEREMRAAMDAALSDDIPGAAARKKSLAIVSGLWIRPQGPTRALRGEALTILPRLSERARLAIHWGLAMAAFPFFFEFAEQAGRLLRLQEEFSSAQVIRRLRERFGDRETVERAAYHVRASLVEWRVVVPTDRRGIFGRGAVIEIEEPDAGSWLLQAVLAGLRVTRAPVRTAVDCVALFPLLLPTPDVIRAHAAPRLHFFTEGVDQEMVAIAT